MADAQPWADDLPVHVHSKRGCRRQRFLTRRTDDHDDERPDTDQRRRHHGLFHELDHPDLEIVGEAAGVGALSK